MNAETINAAINAEKAKDRPELTESRRVLYGKINKHNRIRNKLLRNIRERRGAAKRRVAKDLSVLRRSGIAPSAALLGTAQALHNPIPRALQGQVKQAGRTLSRFHGAKSRAAARRQVQEAERLKELEAVTEKGIT